MKKTIWILNIKNLTKGEVMDNLFMGMQYESIKGEVHVWYDTKKILLEDLHGSKIAMEYEIIKQHPVLIP